MSDTDTILGFIPKDNYVKITYLLILGSGVVGIVSGLLAIVGLSLGLGGLGGVMGLVGLVLALIGFFGFKAEFSALDQAHLGYLAVLFAVLFVVSLIVNVAIGGIMPIALAALIGIILSLLSLVLVFTGFNSWGHGRSITKDNLASELQLAIKRV